MRAALLLLAALVLAGCPQPLPPVPPGPAPAGATCESVCAHGAELGCPWAAPTPAFRSCADVCGAAAAILPWNVDCIQAAPTCEAAEACQ